MPASETICQSFNISPRTGYLSENSVLSLPPLYNPWHDLTRNLSDLVSSRQIRKEINRLDVIPTRDLTSLPDLRLAHVQLSSLASGYVWCDGEAEVPAVLPAQIAIPLYDVSARLKQKPIICHSDGVLWNTQFVDVDACRNSEIPTLEGMRMISLKLIPEPDLDYFFLVTAKMEVINAPIPFAMVDAIFAAEAGDHELLTDALRGIRASIGSLETTIGDMYRYVDPDAFFNRVRPFLASYDEKWFPEGGIIFDGVSETPMKLFGGSAAQSSIFQSLDAFLGIEHPQAHQLFLRDMVDYMPWSHRQFLAFLRQKSPALRAEILENPTVVAAYNECVGALTSFRSKHLQLVCSYIVNPKSRTKSRSKLDEVGTGGTGFMQFLKGVRDSTKDQLLESEIVSGLEQVKSSQVDASEEVKREKRSRELYLANKPKEKNLEFKP